MKKRLLILGGTRFIGRVFIEQFIERRLDEVYEVSLFNRGRTNAELFPQFNKIEGDRETEDLLALAQQDWDVIVDFSAYFPNSLGNFIQALKGRVGRYIFTSTVSVYDIKEPPQNPVDENFKLKSYTAEDRANEDMRTYGERKVACEDELMNADWLDKIILRPSIVYGQYDYIDRHYYWLYRAKTQSKILVPDAGESRLNCTFVDDYARLNLLALNIERHNTIYNASTHPVCSLQEVLDSAVKAVGRKPEFIHLDKASQEKFKLGYGRKGFPLVYGSDLLIYNHDKVLRDFGVKFHSLDEGLKKTVDYYDKQGWDEGIYGLRIEQEQKIIAQMQQPEPKTAQKVVRINEIDYIDDGQALSPQAVHKTLTELAGNKIIWIAGGQDGQTDYSSLIDIVKRRVRAIICLSRDSSRIKAAFKGEHPYILDCHSIPEAVKMASLYAVKGDLVLLSPGSEADNLFEHSEDRSSKYRELLIQQHKVLTKGVNLQMNIAIKMNPSDQNSDEL